MRLLFFGESTKVVARRKPKTVEQLQHEALEDLLNTQQEVTSPCVSPAASQRPNPPPQHNTLGTAADELQRILAEIDRRRLCVRPVITPLTPTAFSTTKSMTYFSIFSGALGASPTPPAEASLGKRQWQLISDLARADLGCGAAVGAMLGLAIGDSAGAPLEFTAVDDTLPPERGYPDTRPHLSPALGSDADGTRSLQYRSPEDKFRLKRGQWTDDCSMALCLADSLLVNRSYHGGDARVRWHMWWNTGYCNTFRFTTIQHKRASVGLGGNIASSLAQLDELPPEQHDVDSVPPVLETTEEERQDAGNGSIMRLAPVPLAFHNDMAGALKVAEWQSRATHPGSDAVACCKFMTFLMVKALQDHKRSLGVGRDGDAVRRFIDKTVRHFLDETRFSEDTGMAKVRAVLQCKPPSAKEANWDWKKKRLQITEAIAHRKQSEDGTYNGYPVLLTYFGAYCMDGLAMALWALYHSNSFSECIIRAVNLLGDADTIGAIAGQMAGAIYGWKGIADSDMGQVFLRDLRQWDPYCEIGLRAACLYHSPAEERLHPSQMAFAEQLKLRIPAPVSIEL
eukprot:TRINITY_DN1948_c0_g1_i1.p1 TRINITY_DN1948_c0_g1~~TRINITY_DN1948_c0_g1_i1.p1  ORF type:complete len:568 (+),score=150.75 TRINITY_DN1948_c0_g1_i1:164-1867(+)